jgi:hypothetical protein
LIERIRARLTYANVMATVAVFIALGGSAVAGTVVITSNSQVASGTISGHHPPAGAHANVISGSINSQDLATGGVDTADLASGAVNGGRLAPNSVDGSKVRNGSLTGIDIDQSTLALKRSGFHFRGEGDPPITLINTGHVSVVGSCADAGGGQTRSTIRVRSVGGDLVTVTADSDTGHTEGSDSGTTPVTVDQLTSAAVASDRGSFDALAVNAGGGNALDGQFSTLVSASANLCAYSAVGVAG